MEILRPTSVALLLHSTEYWSGEGGGALQLPARPLCERELEALSWKPETIPLMTPIGLINSLADSRDRNPGICVFLFVHGLFRQVGPTGIQIMVVPVVVPVGCDRSRERTGDQTRRSM